MDINVVIDPSASTPHECARVVLVAEQHELCELDIELSAIGFLGAEEWALDLLVLATTVYAIDKMTARSSAPDGWTRMFKVSIPVASPELWNDEEETLADALSFLTGDRWTLTFTKRTHSVYRPHRRRRRRRLSIRPNAVCLLSGGLDSLIGAIDWLEANPHGHLLVVGHHDGKMSGPMSDQEALLKKLRPAFPGRLEALLVRVGHSETAREITLRSRSLVFIALALYASSALGVEDLLVPENGTISVNVPLTPSRRGSCSTRTTHPHFMGLIETVTAALGSGTSIENPLRFKTKGEAVAQCANQALLRRAALDSVSCAKRGHTKTWIRRSANGCGRCMPCIYRRASLHTINLDTEQYGCDICKDEVDVDRNSEEGPNDLRACFSFLRRDLAGRELERLLMASAPLDSSLLASYARVVEKAMDEIRDLLRAKGSKKIKALAGLT